MSDTNPYWPLPSPDALGGLVGADDVHDALKATILEWAPYYTAVLSSRLEAAGRIGNRNQPDAPLGDFGTWVNEPDRRNFGTGTPAAFMTRVLATVGEPLVEGTRKVIATWRAQVTVQAFGLNWEEARDYTSWYEKIIRWSVMQHRSLGGFAMSTKWIGSQYGADEHDSTRTIGTAVLGFDVKVADVLDISRGPAAVPNVPEAPDQDPTVATTSATVTNASPTGPLIPEED